MSLCAPYRAPDFTIIGFPWALSHHTTPPSPAWMKTLMAEILCPYSAVTRPINPPSTPVLQHPYNAINEASSLFIYPFECISTMHVRLFLKLVVAPTPYCSHCMRCHRGWIPSQWPTPVLTPRWIPDNHCVNCKTVQKLLGSTILFCKLLINGTIHPWLIWFVLQG